MKCLVLQQSSKTAPVMCAEGCSDRSDPCRLISSRLDPALQPLTGSCSPQRHEDEEDEAEAALLWVMQKCTVDERTGVVCLTPNMPLWAQAEQLVPCTTDPADMLAWLCMALHGTVTTNNCVSLSPQPPVTTPLNIDECDS